MVHCSGGSKHRWMRFMSVGICDVKESFCEYDFVVLKCVYVQDQAVQYDKQKLHRVHFETRGYLLLKE